MTVLSSEELQRIKSEAESSLAEARDSSALEAWRVKYLGRKGFLPMLLRQLKDLSPEQKRELGPLGNQVRQELEQQLEASIGKQEASKTNEPPSLKPKTYNLEPGSGHLHPLTQTVRRLQKIFVDLGFNQVEGPLIEDQYFDFDALNIPPEHPSRAESDTFYIDNKKRNVLRTSTSAVQVRSVGEMNLKPPFKIFSPGRVFRAEKIDPTHSHTFHQVEALAVGEDITIADYVGLTQHLFSEFFGKDVIIRLRPGYFPFVEPGFEPDMSCVFCSGEGCRVCKQTGWIEIGGAGMVHPRVLENMGIDAEKYQGFAFGYGVERLTMLRHGINDIRLFMGGDLRFLRQF